MVYEPPSGVQDLASQTDDIERAQVAADREALIREQALVRQRRAARPQVLTEQAYADPFADPAPAPADPGPVIDSDGTVYELDKSGEVVRDGDGNPVPAGEYDRDADGVVVFDGDGKPLPVWTHGTLELYGLTIQARKPQPAALQAFSMAVSKHTPVKTQNDLVALFVRRHISDRSYNDLLGAMMDPETAITIKVFGELMSKIATLGTSRPTLPSRP